MRYTSRIVHPLSAGLIAAFSAGIAPASAQTAPAMPPAAAAPPFDIMEYVVDGNTVLPIPEVEDAVYPFLGEKRSADDVDKARDALEQIYRSRGFQTVQVVIPQQGVESGIIHLQVIENPVGRLRVVDSRYHSLDRIKSEAPSLSEGTVLNTNDVQKDIVALNQQPNLTVTPRLKAGAVPGTVDVDLEVEDHFPVHASVEINNQHADHTSELRVIGSVGYDNLWQAGHSVNLSYQVAPQNPSDAKVLSGSYMARLPRSGVSLLAYGVKSDSDVAALAGTDVVGRGDIFGARAIVNLPGTDKFFHSLTVGVDRKNLSQNVITGGTPSNAPVLYYPVTLAYAAGWHDGEEVTDADVSLNFAAPAGSGSDKFDAQEDADQLLRFSRIHAWPHAV